MPLELKSSAFENGGSIPIQFTCDGRDTSPPLRWSGVPERARSLALIADDPDAPDPAAPRRTYVHWVAYDIPVTTRGFDEGQTAASLGGREGTNDWNRTGYGGPCPPIGRHRYFFKLYALDTILGDRGPLRKAQLESVMSGHVLASTELVGTYQRGRTES